MSLTYLALVFLAFTLAGSVKGLVGLGLPPTAMGVLVLAMTPVEAAALIIVPSFATNVWQAMSGPHLRKLVHRFWPMLLAGPAATLAGTGWLANGDPSLAIGFLGVTLALYALIMLLRAAVSIPYHRTQWLNPLVGFLTGSLTAATGVSAVPAVPYLQALDLEPGELVQALGLVFTTTTIALAINLAWSNALRFDQGWIVGLTLFASGFGVLLGRALRRRIDPVAFRKVFLVALLLLGIYLITRALLW